MSVTKRWKVGGWGELGREITCHSRIWIPKKHKKHWSEYLKWRALDLFRDIASIHRVKSNRGMETQNKTNKHTNT